MIPACQSANPPVSETSPGWLSARGQIVLGACACAGASAFLYAVNPSEHAVYPQCVFYKMTGFYCAGCGATRALYALLHGQVFNALHDNILFVAALPIFLYVVGSYLFKTWQSRAWPKVVVDEKKLVKRGLWILLLMLSFMAVRNLPGWPFDWLKPLAGQ